VSVFHVDQSIQDLQKPTKFFTKEWAAEILGTYDIETINIGPTRKLWHNPNAHFLNHNAMDLIQNRAIVRGSVIITPQNFTFQ
jgi:hypothetical protein